MVFNLERDMLWRAEVPEVTAANFNVSAASPNVPNSGSVMQVHSYAAANGTMTASGTAGDVFGFGALILPCAEGDNTPYRLKGAIFAPANVVAWGVGYFDSSGPTVEVHSIVDYGPRLDQTLVMRPLISSDPNYDLPLCFFGYAGRANAGYFRGSLSVQRLLSKPDQFASAVS